MYKQRSKRNKMENPALPTIANISQSTTAPAEETSKTIILLGYPEVDDQGIPPPPDPTYAGPVGPIVIRTEEVLIVVFVLILWAGAIALFFNRWGKIRMLEPYQPKFHEEEHRPSCPLVELSATGHTQHRTSLSKYNVTAGCLEPTSLYQTLPPAHRSLWRSRQNSVFAGNSNIQLANGVCCPRKTRSAIDINSLIQHESPSTRQNSSILPMSATDRRLSSTLKDKRSCSLFPPGMHDRRRSCMGECSMTFRDRYGYRDSLSPHLPHSFRRTSCAVGDHMNPSLTRDRKPSFNNVLAQVTAERRPSSSMLRISNV